jgi:hypothetical protein
VSYPCPCCGYCVLAEPPGSHDICPICFWEDDVVQLRWVTWAGGANRPSLVDAQRNYAAFACSEARFIENVRPPRADERRDPSWRLADVTRDVEPHVSGVDYGATYPADSTTLYYWRDDYWRRAASIAGRCPLSAARDAFP